MPRFATLLHREWMQHHRAYLWLTMLPATLLLAVAAFSPGVNAQPNDPMVLMTMGTSSLTMLVLLIGTCAACFQLPSSMRRDRQDRSIEFWLSLPVSNTQAVGAQVLMHGLLMPLMALGIGFVFSQAFVLLLTIRLEHFSNWLHLPWSDVLPALLVVALRTVLGVVLGALWLSPILMLFSLCHALTRWGIPALGIGVGVLCAVLAGVYGNHVLPDLLAAVMTHVGHAVVPLPGQLVPLMGEDLEKVGAAIAQLPALLVRDTGRALAETADPLFVGGLAVNAACFAALTKLRSREA